MLVVLKRYLTLAALLFRQTVADYFRPLGSPTQAELPMPLPKKRRKKKSKR